MILITHPPTARRADEIDPSTLERKKPRLPAAGRRDPEAAAAAGAPARTRTDTGARSDTASGEPEGPHQHRPAFRGAPEGADPPARGRPDQGSQGRALAHAAPADAALLRCRRRCRLPSRRRRTRRRKRWTRRPGREGLKLPPGLTGQTPSGQEGPQAASSGRWAPRSRARSTASRSARCASRAPASRTGTGQQMGALFFDPQGADFTLWINRFKDEVYRNWNIPEAANLGAARGHVDFEFVVERDGTMSSLRMREVVGDVLARQGGRVRAARQPAAAAARRLRPGSRHDARELPLQRLSRTPQGS